MVSKIPRLFYPRRCRIRCRIEPKGLSPVPPRSNRQAASRSFRLRSDPGEYTEI